MIGSNLDVEISKSFDSFEKDMNWYLQKSESLKENFRGRFILIKDSEVKLSAETAEELRGKAEKAGIDISLSVVEFIPKKDIVAM